MPFRLRQLRYCKIGHASFNLFALSTVAFPMSLMLARVSIIHISDAIRSCLRGFTVFRRRNALILHQFFYEKHTSCSPLVGYLICSTRGLAQCSLSPDVVGRPPLGVPELLPSLIEIWILAFCCECQFFSFCSEIAALFILEMHALGYVPPAVVVTPRYYARVSTLSFCRIISSGLALSGPFFLVTERYLCFSPFRCVRLNFRKHFPTSVAPFQM